VVFFAFLLFCEISIFRAGFKYFDILRFG
jgi:hypothetical protein